MIMTDKKEIELAASLPEWKEKYNFRSYLIFDGNTFIRSRLYLEH